MAESLYRFLSGSVQRNQLFLVHRVLFAVIFAQFPAFFKKNLI